MKSDEEKIIAEFDRCPVCGGSRRFAESVANEQREKGLIGEGLKYGIYEMGGPILDPSKVSQMLVGTMVPTVTALIDVCLDCGAIYAVRLERGEIPLGVVAAKPPLGPVIKPPAG